MNIQKTFAAAFVAAVFAAVHFPVEKASAQAEDSNRYSIPISMVVNGGASEERLRTSDSAIMGPVGLRPREQVAVTLNVPTSWNGYSVGFAPLDGGEIASPDGEVKGNGTTSFAFEGGDSPGLYRVLVTIGVHQYQLQFYVVTPTHVEGLCP